MRNLTAFLCLTFAVLLFSAEEGFALPPCQDDAKIWHNCVGTDTAPNGDRYVGEWRDNQPNGQGTTTYGSSSQWAGAKYVGEYRDGNFHGQGTYTYSPSSQWAGAKYVGEFRDGNFHGQGTYTSGDGIVTIGIWKNNEFQYALDPEQAELYAERERVAKEKQEQRRIAKEKREQERIAKEKREQERIASEKRAQQRIAKQKGEQERITREREKQERERIAKEIGEEEAWSLPMCPGSYNQNTWDNCFGTLSVEGTTYVGEFRNNRQHGQGTYTWTNGENYAGEWRDGNFNGEGTYTYADGSVKEGVWKNDEFQYAKNDPRNDPSNRGKEELGIVYQLYLTVRGCHELGELYVSSAKMESIKSMMKAIDKYITTENNTLDTDAIWETAVNQFDSSYAGKGLELIKMLDSPYYDEEMGGICRLQTMQLENIGNSPEIGAKEKKKKDF